MEAANRMRTLLASVDHRSLLDPERLRVGNRLFTPEQVLEALNPFLTEARLQRIDEVIASRTCSIAIVLEKVIDTGNVSAVMRTAEGLGFMNFHIIPGREPFKHSKRTTQGAQKWLDLYAWPSSSACISHLRDEGFHIVAMHVGPDAVPIADMDFTRKTALLFGNERDGVSPEALDLADSFCTIPMTGFTQSFNISVAAAVSLYHIFQDRLSRQGFQGDLSAEERNVLRAVYCMASVNHAGLILKRMGQEGECY